MKDKMKKGKEKQADEESQEREKEKTEWLKDERREDSFLYLKIKKNEMNNTESNVREPKSNWGERN